MHLAVGKRDGLFRREDDVFVVREHIHHLGGSRLDGVQDVVGGGVHGLAARDNLAAAEILEQGAEALPRGNGDKAVFLLRLHPFKGFRLVGALGVDPAGVGVLYPHILHLDGFELAVFHTLRQSLARVVGVDMDLDDLLIVYHHHTVADGFEIGAQQKRIAVVPFITCNDELGAVCKGDVRLKGTGGADAFTRCGRFGRGVPLDDGAAPEHVLHGAQNDAEPLPARIHHTGLFQHRQQIGCPGEGGFCFVADDGPHRFDRRILGRGGNRFFGRLPGDGEDSPLGGLHNGLIRGFHPHTERRREIGATCLALTLESLGKAAEQQGENHPGIAPGAPEKGRGGGIGGFADGGILQAGQFPGGGGQGHRHIGTRVPIGDRENIQLVDRLLFLAQAVGRGDHRVPQYLTLYQFQHSLTGTRPA